MDWGKLRYAINGLPKRLRQPRQCPSCGSLRWGRRDRKGFHELLRCETCHLSYRWPYETLEEMERFYQRSYRQPGLTTDLPDAEMLKALLESQFSGTAKDFSRVLHLLEILSISRDARILDFGANWGYGVWQFEKAGFKAVGYEVSKPRAEFSKELGVEVLSEWSDVQRYEPFDVVFSSHVLEHTPNPSDAIRKKLSVVRPGGLFIAYFPNGSREFQARDIKAFHRLWGWVHPVMLGQSFIQYVLADHPCGIGAHCAGDLDALRTWDRRTNWLGTLDSSELLVVCKRSFSA